MWDKLCLVFDSVVIAHDINSAPLTSRVQTALYARANLEFLNETGDDAVNNFPNLCVPLYKLALEGNWPEANRLIVMEEKLKNAAIAKGWPTVLHIASGANHIHFVKELLRMLDDEDIVLQDFNGNTAFCIAAAAGNMEIVDLMLERNIHLPDMTGGNGYTPIQFAAMQGRCKMTWYLYDKTEKVDFRDEDWNLLFFTCIYTGIYGKYY
ncbi:ankyrin repeat-containing protein [Trifolium medium]|uniref:Ankyrin repeat-containing protein n=1 Tax=Trifolium medium TaxID=97028 RepID=A0A392NLW7_9FABA|nr:ankyrin repeat-containing protein [Trifolium medium]